MASSTGGTTSGEHKATSGPKPIPVYVKVIYIALNVFAACAIVFANKIVFSVYLFKFVTTLTLIHTLFTWTGMVLLQRTGFFEAKKFTQMEVAPLALGYVGYVVLNNLSLNLNTVGLYQILKITITPAVIVLEFLLFRKVQTVRILLAVTVVCVGVAIAAVTDTVAISNVIGVAVGLASVVITGLYQIWAGSKQKELKANSSQLLLAYTPQAIAVLSVLSPLLDDIGLGQRTPGPDTVLGFNYTPAAITAIVVSGLLGVLVSLSTFLVIGATSSLTYNVVGHSKTILILAGGCLLFNEAMPWKRLMGIAITMGGIFWYTKLTMQQAGSGSGSSGSSVSATATVSLLSQPEGGSAGKAAGADLGGGVAGRGVARLSTGGAGAEREPLLGGGERRGGEGKV